MSSSTVGDFQPTWCPPVASRNCRRPFICLCWAEALEQSPRWHYIGLITVSFQKETKNSLIFVSSASFYWLQQFRRVRRSLDDESAAILVHAFVTSRIDYCNLLLAGAPKSVITDKLQRVMNAAARVVSATKKYDRGLTHLLHSELHWLDVADRVTYKLGVTVYNL